MATSRSWRIGSRRSPPITSSSPAATWRSRAGRRVSWTTASFWAKGVPLVPFFPFFAAAIRRERQTGFLPPVFGTSGRRGFFAEIPFFWAISDSQDATLGLDFFERRGVGGSAEYRYILSERQRGGLGGFWVHESMQHHDDRGWGPLAG